MFTISDYKEIENPVFQAAYNKWRQLAGEKLLPDMDGFNKGMLGEMAAYCKVVDVQEGERFYYEYVGSTFKELYKDIEGKYLDEVYGVWIRANTLKSYQLCVEEKAAVYNKKGFSTIVGSIGYEYIVLPFCRGGVDSVESMLCVVLPNGVNVRQYEEWKKIIDETPWL